MKTLSVKKLTEILLGIGGLVLLVGAGCGRAPSPVAPTAAAAVTSTAAGLIQPSKSLFLAFTKIPAGFSDQTIAPAPDVRLMVFQIDASRGKGVALTELQFMIFGGMLDGSGGLPSGYLTNFRLLSFPKGLDGPSTVIAVNDGLGWTPGFTPDTFLRMDVTPGFVLKQNVNAVFALVADVSGAPARFQPHLQIAMVNIDGVVQPLVNPGTCDLPLAGDGFIVH